MRLIRRVVATLMMAVIAAIGVRLGGKGGTPRQHGGWKPVNLDQIDAGDQGERFEGLETLESFEDVDRVPVAVAARG